MQIEDAPSPNFDERKHPIDMLVVHYTGMETGEAALARMRDPDAKVAAHYMVWEDGRIACLVAEDKRAWHAGVSTWQGDDDLNSRSIGIEIVNGGHDWPRADGGLPPYPDAQIEAVVELSNDILARRAIPQSRIVGHSDIAPARKADPGEHFPWERLAAAGVGFWPSQPDPDQTMGVGLGPRDEGAAVGRLQAALAEIGYGIDKTGAFDEATSLVVTAFQRRWHPARVSGLADIKTVALVETVRKQYIGA